MKKSEVIFAVVLLGSLLVPSALCGQWWLFSTFMIFGVIFGLLEWLAVSMTGQSVSQHFWEFSKKNRAKAWIILISMLIGWLALLIHLGSKLFTK